MTKRTRFAVSSRNPGDDIAQSRDYYSPNSPYDGAARIPQCLAAHEMNRAREWKRRITMLSDGAIVRRLASPMSAKRACRRWQLRVSGFGVVQHC